MAELTPTPDEAQHPHKNEHAGGLFLIGLFKLSKALFFGAVGAGALHLVHTDLGEIAQHIVDALRISPEGRLASFLMDRADLVGHHQLREAGMFSLLYAALCIVEGLGLMTRQPWAEYFTVILTTAALPWETYELLFKYEPYKIAMLLINIAVLIYLLWILKTKRDQEQTQAESLAEGQ